MNGFRKPLIPGALVLILALGVWLPACSAQDKGAKGAMASDGKTVLAVVDGKPITEADVRAGSAEQFQGLQREYEKNSRDLLEASLPKKPRCGFHDPHPVLRDDHYESRQC